MKSFYITFNEDTIFRKIKSIILGIVGGAWVGMYIGMIVAAIYLSEIKKVDIGGERSWAVAVYGVLFGVPLGVLGGTIVSYIKRNKRGWRILFLLLAIQPFLQKIFYISPLGEVMRLFN